MEPNPLGLFRLTKADAFEIRTQTILQQKFCYKKFKNMPQLPDYKRKKIKLTLAMFIEVASSC